jgi:hypothetical protein
VGFEPTTYDLGGRRSRRSQALSRLSHGPIPLCRRAIFFSGAFYTFQAAPGGGGSRVGPKGQGRFEAVPDLRSAAGFEILWRRPSWVRIPPPAPIKGKFRIYFPLMYLVSLDPMVPSLTIIHDPRCLFKAKFEVRPAKSSSWNFSNSSSAFLVVQPTFTNLMAISGGPLLGPLLKALVERLVVKAGAALWEAEGPALGPSMELLRPETGGWYQTSVKCACG